MGGDGMTIDAPRTAEETGIRRKVLEDLTLKTVYLTGELSLHDLAEHMRASPVAVERAFRDMVLEPHTLRQLGSALVSGKAVFLYGPSGTGKTSVAETLARLFEQENVWIPHAIENDGQIITIYDPLVHQKVDDPAARDSDERWVLCRRPRVVVGGELTIEMLDLQFN